jgi:hypothetical protein
MKKMLIGRRELVDFPDLQLYDVDVKIDTGAYTSSIHVTECKLMQKEGRSLLHVVFLDAEHPSFTGSVILFDEFRQKKVKSSTGHEQIRFIVKLRIQVNDRFFLTDFSLTQRNGMKYPILLGRKLLNKRFIVDSSLMNVLSNNN